MCNLSQGVLERGIARGIERGMEQGIKQGIERGKAEGFGLLESLVAHLLRDHRIDDLEKMTQDTEHRDSLLLEYGLI